MGLRCPSHWLGYKGLESPAPPPTLWSRTSDVLREARRQGARACAPASAATSSRAYSTVKATRIPSW
jgi:hypothetical protein